MARGLNRITLVGTIVQPPELRYTPGGLAILELNLAGNDHVLGDDEVMRELAWYHRVTVFGNQAEAFADQLEVGMPVFADGRLDYRSWETDDGQRRSALDVVANRVDPLTMGARTGETTVADVKGQERLRDAVNAVAIVGNLTRAAELRYTPTGSAVTRFSVAVNERYTDRRGQDQETTHFVDVNVWRELAEAAGELQKGDPVFVTGRLVNDNWTDQQGNRRYVTRVEGDRIEFLTRPNSAARSSRPSNEAASREPVASSGGASNLDIDEEFPPEDDLPF